MDELIKQGQWWWLLIPLGTGVFALVGSWMGAKLGQKTEHQQWLRDQKMETYSQYLTATTAMHDALRGHGHKSDEALKECIGVLTSGSAAFVAPARVEALIRDFTTHYLEHMYQLAVQKNAGVERPTIADDAPSAKALEKATSKLRQAMRDDLKIKA